MPGPVVALLEDDPMALDVLAHLCRQHGVVPVPFTDPLKCLAWLGDRASSGAAPFALITDVGLTPIDGVAVARLVRRTVGLEGVRVVAVSGHFGQGGMTEDSMRALGVTLVPKGEVAKLVAAVKQLVEDWRCSQTA